MEAAHSEYMERFFEELEPESFYRELFGYTYLSSGKKSCEYPLHGTIIDITNRARHEPVWNDLEALKIVQSADRFAIMAPASYIGFHRSNENARQLFAIAIDLDYLTEYGIQNLFSQIEKAEVLPRPTMIVCSGSGLHLYYCFDKPIPCYEYNRRKIQKYKTALTRKIWNAYITEGWKKPQIESVFQPMRVVGSGTKSGAIARGFLTGEKIDTDYLDAFVKPEYQIGNLEKRGTLETWKLLDPEWYAERVEEKKPRKYWTCNRALYDNWLGRIKREAVVNHRYFAVMALAIYGIKCAVPFEEVKRDAYSLLPLFDSMTVEENNHFTEDDIESALRAYKECYKTFPRRSVEELTAIAVPANRRNGRSAEEHLELARAARDINQRRKGTKWNGRKSKESIVLEWRSQHKDGTKTECIRDTGLSKPTVYKHWNAAELPAGAAEGETEVMRAILDSSTLDELLDALGRVPKDKLRQFYADYKEEIDAALEILQREKE